MKKSLGQTLVLEVEIYPVDPREPHKDIIVNKMCMRLL